MSDIGYLLHFMFLGLGEPVPIPLILSGVVSVIVAQFKGFQGGRWLFAFGIVGLIVVFFLKGATGSSNPEELKLHAAKANYIGAWLGSFGALLIAIRFLIIVGASGNSSYAPLERLVR